MSPTDDVAFPVGSQGDARADVRRAAAPATGEAEARAGARGRIWDAERRVHRAICFQARKKKIVSGLLHNHSRCEYLFVGLHRHVIDVIEWSIDPRGKAREASGGNAIAETS